VTSTARAFRGSHLATVRQLRTRAIQRAASFYSWLPLQLECLRDTAQARLFRAGNQTIGKTVVGAEDLACHVTGVNPYNPDSVRKDRPITAVVIFGNKDQSVGVQRKIFEAIPPELLHPSTKYSEEKGLISRKQTFRVKHVPTGRWSVVYFRTDEQGAPSIKGITADYIWCDEIPTFETHREARKRITQAGKWGRILITATMVNNPAGWLHDDVKAGLYSDHWRPLTPAELVPVGRDRPLRLDDGTPKDADWIAKLCRETPDYLIPVLVHGEWEVRSGSRVFGAFRDGGASSHVSEREPDGERELVLGFDWGTKAVKQVCLFVQIQRRPNGPHVYVTDEYVAEDGSTTLAMDARAVIGMLTRHGWAWADMDRVYADRSYVSGHEAKSAQLMQKWIAVEIGDVAKPDIRTVKRGDGRGRGSVMAGVRWLHDAMVEGRFFVHPRCRHVIAALNNWTGQDDDWKDKIDALRYALDQEIFAPVIQGNAVRIRFR